MGAAPFRSAQPGDTENLTEKGEAGKIERGEGDYLAASRRRGSGGKDSAAIFLKQRRPRRPHSMSPAREGA